MRKTRYDIGPTNWRKLDIGNTVLIRKIIVITDECTGVARISVWGAPGRRHPALHQSCTRLKQSREAGDLSALQQSAELCVEPLS